MFLEIDLFNSVQLLFHLLVFSHFSNLKTVIFCHASSYIIIILLILLLILYINIIY